MEQRCVYFCMGLLGDIGDAIGGIVGGGGGDDSGGGSSDDSSSDGGTGPDGGSSDSDGSYSGGGGTGPGGGSTNGRSSGGDINFSEPNTPDENEFNRSQLPNGTRQDLGGGAANQTDGLDTEMFSSDVSRSANSQKTIRLPSSN